MSATEMKDATHTGTITWPLETRNGPDGKRAKDLKKCAYGWTSGGLRWKKDGSSPQASVSHRRTGEREWVETYFGLEADTIRPLGSVEIRRRLQADLDAAKEALWRAAEKRARALSAFDEAADAAAVCEKALAQFDQEEAP